jgi:epoxyqueuosine reductase
MELAALFDLDEAAFRTRFRHTPLWRAKRRGLLRNAAIVLGNRPHPPALPALIRGLNDGEPLIRGACAWALGNYSRSEVIGSLQQRLFVESDQSVRDAIQGSCDKLVDQPFSQSEVSSGSTVGWRPSKSSA